MLKNLRIQNFKCWEDTGTIDMAPITLFFGTNSSGKSSIGQFLMMLKQTVEHDQEVVFYLGRENSEVQLNSYEEMVFRNNLESNIKFEYQWSFPTQDNSSEDSLVFEAEVDFQGSIIRTRKIPSISKFEYRDKSQRSLEMERKAYREYVVRASRFNLNPRRSGSRSSNDITKKDGEIVFSTNPVRFYRFPRNVTNHFANIGDFSTKCHSEHEKLFSSLFYIGPLRTNERRYNYSAPPTDVGHDGRHTVGAIVAAQEVAKEREIGMGRVDRSFEKFIAGKLKQMGLIEGMGESFKVDDSIHQMFEAKLRTKGSNTWVNLLDVGFGISQVLPVLVQCFYVPRGSIILIDQPEVHLHPYAQSALADVMIDATTDRNIQLIIETHSEHFLRRLQRRIAEDKKLSQDKVAAYFAYINEGSLDGLVRKYILSESQQEELKRFEKAGILSANELANSTIDKLSRVHNIGPAKANEWKERAKKYVDEETKAQLERLKINEYGNILNWPKNFFGNEMEDILAQAEEGMKRRLS